MTLQPEINLVHVIIDEVALEGLDGITLEALWQRLGARFNKTLPLSKFFMQEVWETCLQIRVFSFYQLEKPRDPLVIYDRYELECFNVDVAQKQYIPKDIYPHCPVDDINNGNRGSCESYFTRTCINEKVENLNVDEVESIYGQKLVIVASQVERELALMGDDVQPNLDLTIIQYCFLERVGRARYFGEVTLGTASLACMDGDPKTMFYHRKRLLRYKLIKKQVYHQTNCGQRRTGSLLHLPRFFVERKPKVVGWAECVINFLKTKENYMADYNEIKDQLQIGYSLKKFFTLALLQRVFKTDIRVPHRRYYPISTEQEWQVKNNPQKERTVRLVQLVDPTIEISDLWSTEEANDEDETVNIDISEINSMEHFLTQCKKVVESRKEEGISQSELGEKMGLMKLISRTAVRNLVKTKSTNMYLDDVGRQRVTKYVARRYNSKSRLRQEFQKEKSKIEEFNRSTQKYMEEKAITQDEEMPYVEPIPKICEEVKQASESLLVSFNAINKIFNRYKLFKFKINKYKVTTNANVKEAHKIFNIKRLVRKKKKKAEKKDLETDGHIRKVINESEIYKMIETKLVAQKPLRQGKSVTEVIGFMERLRSSASTLTFRLLRRANMIIEAVKDHKIIDDMVKLTKMINEEEDKEGYDVKIDKKSLIRLLQKLAKDNLIKFIRLTLSVNTKQKTLTFICDPCIGINHTVIQSAVEQAKMKFCLAQSRARQKPLVPSPACGPADTSSANTNTQPAPPVKKVSKRMNVKIGKMNGFCPKFIRMQSLHTFLYHLIYVHPRDTPLSKVVLHEALVKEGYSDTALLEEMAPAYTTEISWKMFIPPIHQHLGWPRGWALMCDILLRMPLSIFVKVHNVSTIIPGLKELLEHPIRKYYLVKDLSPAIRNALLDSRKYIYSVHETITRLCYTGLVQFGPQKLKEKDQVFIYLNRRTELMDTTSSGAGYHQIEPKNYTVTKFYFDSLQVVENYWYELWSTCINTCLGGRLVVQGKEILLEYLGRKAEMVQAIKARKPEEAPLLDTGVVPGDRKGAAGIDSAFFPHLKRNWNWGNNYLENPHLRKIAKEKKNSIARSFPISSNRPVIIRPPVLKTSISGARKKSTAAKKPKPEPVKPFKPLSTDQAMLESANPKSYTRTMMPRKKPVRKRVKYDEVDYSALQRMDKLRVDWDIHEDNILLVCKVAMVYLSPNPRRKIVNFQTVRDILRSFSFSSHNKTSRACQRRLLYMLKQPQTVNSVMLGVEEVKQDYFVNKRFSGIVDKVKHECRNGSEYEERLVKIFKDLVTYIAKKYYDIANKKTEDLIGLPQTMQEFHLLYRVRLPKKSINSKGFTRDVRDTNDIHSATINSVIHSSMCCGKERRSWAYQLFKVYQQYPEFLLRNAMMKIRSDMMVAIKKNYMMAIKKYGNCMPMSSSQYQLSAAYYYKFQTQWPYEIFYEAYVVHHRLLEWYADKQSEELNYSVPDDAVGIEVCPVTGGAAVSINDYVAADLLNIDIEIPDQVIMLDPRLREKSEVYQRIAQRYQDILRSLTTDLYISGNSVDEATDSADVATNSLDEPVYEVVEEKASVVKSRATKRKAERDEDPAGQSKRLKMEYDAGEAANASESVLPEDSEEMETELVLTTKVITGGLETEKSQTDNEEESRNPRNAAAGSVVRVKELIKNIDNSWIIEEITSNREEISPTKKEKTSSKKEPKLPKEPIMDLQRKTTRIAFLKMREELHDLTIADSHHAHEYFVVNSFKQLYSLKLPKIDEPRDMAEHRGLKVPAALLPIQMSRAAELVNRVKEFATFPINHMTYADFKAEVCRTSSVKWQDVDKVCNHIKSGKQLGLNLPQIVDKFEKLGDSLDEILSLLAKKRIVLRTGVTDVRYIHRRHADPWLINSYKIHRLEKEAQVPLAEGSVYLLNNDNDKRTPGDDEIEIIDDNVATTSAMSEMQIRAPTEEMCQNGDDVENHMDDNDNRDENREEDPEENSEENSEENPEAVDDDENNNDHQTRMRRNRTLLLPQKDIYRAAKMLDFTTAEAIKVVIKPWIRVDGVLNRRVLDRMMGAILTYCVKHPGLSLTKVQNRFTPALQPYHTRELVELLVQLDCLQTTVLKVPKTTLFSKASKAEFVGNPNLTANNDIIIIEPTLAANLKFGMFLSNKQYTVDFLSSL